jgi:TolB protein
MPVRSVQVGAILALALLAFTPAPGLAVSPTTVRVSIASSGAQANGASWGATISADGTAVAFNSNATNLSGSPDTNRTTDVFVHSLTTTKTVRVSVSTTGAQANGPSVVDGISADGRYVLFTSSASNLVAHDTNGRPDVFVRDIAGGRTRRVDVTRQGRQLRLGSTSAALSPNGRYAEFAGMLYGVYVRDLLRRTTSLVSIQPNGRPFPSLGPCGNCAPFAAGGVSEGGRVVVFEGNPNLGFPPKLWARNRVTQTTVPVESGNSTSLTTAATGITPNGRYVAFTRGDFSTGDIHVYVRDLHALTTTSVGHYSIATNAPMLFGPTGGISSDGNRVVYVSGDSGLVAGDTNNAWDAFLRDVSGNTVTRVSLSSAGAQLDKSTQGVSISADGSFVAFSTNAAAVAQDTNRTTDIYVRGPLP